MSAQEFRRGELVDVTIKGARVLEAGDQVLHIAYPTSSFNNDAEVYLRHDMDAVVVERVAPAGWPPRPGDLWRTADGDLLFCAENLDCSDQMFFDQRGNDLFASSVLRKCGPLTLIHREPERKDGES